MRTKLESTMSKLAQVRLDDELLRFIARRDTLVGVPIISAFFGIMIRMFYREHEPAHFHAEYQGQLAKFSFDGKLTAGRIDSKTAKRLIRQWAVLHRAELEANWQKMKAGQTLDRIAPLE